MNSRQEAILKQWSEGMVWCKDPYQKKLRSKLKQAIATVEGCISLFGSFDVDHPEIMDIASLRNTSTLLRQLFDDFEVAQRGGPVQLDRNSVFLSDFSAG